MLLAGLNHRNTPSGNVKSSRAFPLSTLSLPLLPASNHRLRATSYETRILHKQSSGINTFRVIVPKSSRLTPSRPGPESDTTIKASLLSHSTIEPSESVLASETFSPRLNSGHRVLSEPSKDMAKDHLLGLVLDDATPEITLADVTSAIAATAPVGRIRAVY